MAPWMLTYSDLVTQILVFFVILFSISTIDVQRFRLLLSAFRGSLGVLERGRTFDQSALVASPPLQVLPLYSYTSAREQLQQVYRELAQMLETAGLQERVELIPEERGLVVRFSDRVLFDLGRVDLRPEAREVLDAVAAVLKGLPNPIRVEGHTDNLPIRTERFPSNWELSVGRATAVVRYFIERHGMDPRRLSAAGYGEYRPLVPNTSEANRQRNRRVDVVILSLTQHQEPSPAPGPSKPI